MRPIPPKAIAIDSDRVPNQCGGNGRIGMGHRPTVQVRVFLRKAPAPLFGAVLNLCPARLTSLMKPFMKVLQPMLGKCQRG